MTSTSTLCARAYAKINLGLEVLHRRADGYHELRTILQTIDFYDELRFETRPRGIELTTSDRSLSTGTENLVHRAATLLAEAAGPRRGAAIHLEKRVPPGRGLGGGSSDAAVTLLSLNRLWRAGASSAELHAIARRLGMDVPFFLHGGTALGVGRGDEVYPLAVDVDLPIVLILPDFSISTARAYGNLRLTKRESGLKLLHFAWSDPCVRSGLGELVNDLEGATGERSSSIREYKEILLQRGASKSLMSGSGSAVFGVFRNEDTARGAALSLEQEGIRAIATRTLTSEAYRKGALRDCQKATRSAATSQSRG